MARIETSKEFGETIKTIRIQNKITAKSLAEHINKSPAYISKLEKGDILTIDEENLKKILHFISGHENSIDDIIEKIYATLSFKYSPEEIEDMLWFENFDTTKRKIPIPGDLIDEINRRLEENKVGKEYLLSRINANEALAEDEIGDTSKPYNTWWASKPGTGFARSIKLLFDTNKFYDILNKKIDVSPYIYLYSIAYYLEKIEMYGETIHISIEQNQDLLSKATELLNKHQFYSLTIKSKLLSDAKSKEEQMELLNSFDRENIELVTNILNHFRFISDIDIKDTNTKFSLFYDNLNWDLGFMMKLISLDYYSLQDLSFNKRKEFLEKLTSLLSEYRSLPEDKKTLEVYD